MYRPHLFTSVSVCALTLLGSSELRAQQSLPSIDVGAARVVHPHKQQQAHRPSLGAARSAPTHGPAPVASTHPAPGPAIAAAPAPVADALGHTDKPFSGSYVPASVAHVGDVASVTQRQINETVNVMTSAETIQNLPSTLVRERFIGDRNATIEGRINNPQDSARTMLYADGVLLSNYLGNSYAYPPRWNMVSPVEIERVDVMQGPFSALYGGNSESGVYTITTRMPELFEFHAEGNSSLQYFTWFEDKETDISGHMAAAMGDRKENFSYWVIYDRLDAQGQAQTFSQNQFTTSCGKKCLDAFGGMFAPYVAGGTAPNGFPTPGGTLGNIAGSAGADHSQQHFGKVKLAYDFTPALRATWQTGFWSLVDDTTVQPYMDTKNGVPLFGLGSGIKINDGPFGSYPLGALNPTHSNASHLMNTAEFKSDTKGVFDFDLVGTQYNFLRDYTNTYSQYGFLPTAVNTAGNVTAWSINPTGTNVNQGGNFWRTFDARFIARPEQDLLGKHIVSFGGSDWLYSLNSVQTNTDLATANYYYDIAIINYGKTDTRSAYAQDEWKFLPQWRLTMGARGDWWTAFDGANDALSNVSKVNPSTLVNFPSASKGAFSPKGALEYEVTPDFLLRGSLDRAYRFPTVAEMFQSISTPNTVTMNNPNLQPESMTYYDLTGEYHWRNAFDGAVGMLTPRVSLFNVDAWDYMYNQSNTIGTTTLSQTLNIDKVNFHGIEGVLTANNIGWNMGWHGLNGQFSATFTDSKLLSDKLAPWFDGNQVPRIPRIRLHGSITYSPDDKFSVGATMRFATGSFVSLANTDFSHDSYGSTDSSYLVFDAKAQYKFAPGWTATAGINNIGNNSALVNPNPYPERTYFVGLKYDIGGPRQDIVGLSPGDVSGGASDAASTIHR